MKIYIFHFFVVTACSCLDVRLVGSSLTNEGRLEVNYSGVWGTVCDDYFDYIDAGVVCNSLGFGLVLFGIIPVSDGIGFEDKSSNFARTKY